MQRIWNYWGFGEAFYQKIFYERSWNCKTTKSNWCVFKKVQLEPSDVNISGVAYSFLAKASVPAQDRKKTFRTDCSNFLAAAVCKVLERKLLSARLQDYLIHFLLWSRCNSKLKTSFQKRKWKVFLRYLW